MCSECDYLHPMVRVGFAEAYYDSFTGAQQSMSMLIENAEDFYPILITPRYGKCVTSIHDDIQKEIIEYPEYLDQFSGKLLDGGVLHKSAVAAQLSSYYLYVIKQLHEYSLDVLYCNNLRSLILFAPPAKALGIPIIWYVRIDTSTPFFDSIGLRLADCVVTISDGVRQRFNPNLIERYDHRIQTIYTGVDLNQFNPEKPYGNPYNINPEPLTIAEVASIHPRKRQLKIVDAVARIQSDIPEFQLIFAGSPPEGQKDYLQEIKDRVQEEDLGEEIIFLGWCNNIPALLSQVDIFILPSINEGLPRSILEASAMRVPTIATPAGGTTELLRHEETGLVVPIDNVRELSRAIKHLSINPKTRELYGSNARSLVKEKFSQEKYIDNFEALINRIVRPS